MFRRVTRYHRMLRHQLGFRNDHHLHFIAPQNNWVLEWVGRYVTTNIQEQFGLPSHLVTHSDGLIDHIVHYGSLWNLAAILKHRDFDKKLSKNYLVGTVFHGNEENPAFIEALNLLQDKQEALERIVVSTRNMGVRLTNWGISTRKIAYIPLGIDTQLFVPIMKTKKLALRNQMGIPENAICIGSFQKDGEGNGEGLIPKLIKGPDVFLEVVEQLAKRNNLFVLLTGPARGYVKRGLDLIGVPYRHDILVDYTDIVRYFQASDLYLMTAREEGGPLSLHEAPASGVPLVSTMAGMASDIHVHEKTALLTKIEDVPDLVEQAQRIIDDRNLRENLILNGLKNVKLYDWKMLGGQYFHKIYQPILEN